MSSYIYRTGPYSVFGTSATPKTLTASFVADEKAVQLADGMRFLEVEAQFIPGSNDEFLEIQVETSDDEGHGSPTTFYVFSSEIFPDSAPSATYLGVEGIPWRTPQDVTSPQAGATYRRSFEIDNLKGARWVRISARSTVGSGFGTAFIRIRFST